MVLLPESVPTGLGLGVLMRESQKIPVRELRASNKTDIVELAVVMQAGKCLFIVEFFGCLIRDVSELVEG